MKALKSILSTIVILVIVIIVGSKIFHYFVSKQEQDAMQKIQKAIQNQRMSYEMKLQEGYKAMQEGNYTKAKLLFEDICKNAELYKIPEGCYNLGIMYYNGSGVNKNYSVAKQYFKKAVENGFIDSYSQLAIIENEVGKVKEALDYAKKGCDLDSAMSCFYAGAIYYDGDNIEKNLTLAKIFWKKALKLLPTARMPEAQKDKENIKQLMCNAMPNLCNSNSTNGQ